MTTSPAAAAVIEHHHADVSGGWLRAATFGAMDGLVTNIALIAGVGGGGAGHHTLILTGTAGLVAGAISMGIGEYTSVRTQNEQIGAELGKELHELTVNPEGEADELVAMWVARGLPVGLARQVADVLKDNPEQALRVHAQEELGVAYGRTTTSGGSVVLTGTRLVAAGQNATLQWGLANFARNPGQVISVTVDGKAAPITQSKIYGNTLSEFSTDLRCNNGSGPQLTVVLSDGDGTRQDVGYLVDRAEWKRICGN